MGRHLTAAFAAVVLCVAAGACGRGEDGDKASGRARSPQETVRAYVEALNRRDGERFCSVIAPYLRGRVEVAAKETLEDSDGGKDPCARFVTAYIGHIDEAGPRWLRADIVELAPVRAGGGLVQVSMTLRHHYLDESILPKRRYTEVEADRVFLSRFEGRWRVAKMSRVARRATIGGLDESDPLQPVDVRAEERRFRDLLARQRAQYRSEQETYQPPGRLAGCKGRTAVLRDPEGDLRDQDRPYIRDPKAPEADLVRAEVTPSADRLCAVFALAAPPEGELLLMLRLGGAHPKALAGFGSDFSVERRPDGAYRVTSGLNVEGDPETVAGEVGVQGSRVSLVIRRSPRSRAGSAPKDFAWGVTGVQPRPQERTALIDYAPEGTAGMVTYPAGLRCRNGDGRCPWPE